MTEDEETQALERIRSAGSYIYLNVPYAEKDEAKAAGAFWDARKKTWYLPIGMSADKFAKWIRPSLDPQLPTDPPPWEDRA